MPDKHESASGFQYSITNLKPAEPTEKIALTFPDGTKREFAKGITGLDIAKGISPSSAMATVRLMGNSPISPIRSSMTSKSNSSPATTRARWN